MTAAETVLAGCVVLMGILVVIVSEQCTLLVGRVAELEKQVKELTTAHSVK